MKARARPSVKVDGTVSAAPSTIPFDSTTLAYKGPTPSDEGTTVFLVWLRERIEAQALRSVIWTCTMDMLADILRGLMPPVGISHNCASFRWRLP